MSPAKTLLDLLAEPGGESAGIVAKGMDDRDVERLIQWPYANVCSDGTSTGLHPRGYGSFSKVLGPYVREKKLFPMEEAVRKMVERAVDVPEHEEFGAIEYEFRDAGLHLANDVRQASLASRKKRGT